MASSVLMGHQMLKLVSRQTEALSRPILEALETYQSVHAVLPGPVELLSKVVSGTVNQVYLMFTYIKSINCHFFQVQTKNRHAERWLSKALAQSSGRSEVQNEMSFWADISKMVLALQSDESDVSEEGIAKVSGKPTAH